MGHYGTTFRTRNGSIYIDSLYDIKSLSGITSAKHDARKNVETVKNKIKMMVAATPKDMFPSDEDGDTLFKMEREFDENWEWLESEMMKENEAIIAENIVEDWKYDYGDDKGEPKYEVDPQKDWDKICFQERHEDLGHPMTFDDLKIKDASIDEILQRAQKKFNLENYEDNIQGKYIAFYNGKLFMDMSGRYLWSSEESAINHIIDALSLYSNDYMDKQYLKEHRDVLDSLKQYVPWGMEIKDTFIKKFDEPIIATPELYNECIEQLLNNEKMDFTPFCILGAMISAALKELVRPNITIKQI